MLRIITVPNPILETIARKVTPAELSTPAMQSYIDEMIPTMYKNEGIGLASPQVNRSIRICVIGKDAIAFDRKTTVPHEDLVLVNPVWTRVGKKTLSEEEGCLSIPGVIGSVRRYAEIHVEALDRHGNPLSFPARKFFARVIQHEVDHLDGILFTTKATDLRHIPKK
jgi:peptide deformylase